jgi:ferredoxin
VFPVYAFGPPRIVAEFFEKVPASANTYLFAVATNGGMPGRTFHFIRQILNRRGLSLAAGWAPTLPGNCITLYGGQSRERQDRQFESLPGEIERIAQAVGKQERGKFEDSCPPLSWLLGLVWKIGMPRMGEADRKYFATDACTHCGLCEKICPVQNIRLADGRPEWLHHCEQCMACIQWCPVEAIQYGKKTAGRKRYRHSAIKAEDLCIRGG